jgi:hypothetical protein
MSDTTKKKDFLLYWLPETAEKEFNEGRRLNHAASDQFGRVSPGDALWVVTALNGVLKLVGRMKIASIVGQKAAERRTGGKLWSAKFHAFPPRGEDEPMRMLPLASMQSELRFNSPTSPALEISDGRVNAQQLQTLRELTKASVAMLERLWAERDRAAEGAWRDDRKNAASVLAHLLPSAEQRRVYFEALEAVIGAAHAVSDASWSVSLFTDAIRVNVGQMEIVTLSNDDVYLLLDPPSIPSNLPAALRPLIKPSRRYSSVPGEKVLLHLAGERFASWYSYLKEAHEAMAVRAATAKRGTPHSRAFSESVLLEAERVLGRAVPRPSFLKGSGQLVVLIAMKDDIKLLRKSVEDGKAVEWVVPKTPHAGDEVALFLPGTGFVAKGRLTTEPVAGAGFGKKDRSWRADVADISMLPAPVSIEAVAEALPDWKWPRYPKSFTTVPSGFTETLRELLSRARRLEGDGLPEQAGTEEVFTEGATKSVRVNAFETSAVAKRRCVEHYGCKCFVCGLRFDEIYGPAGEGLIHVHHLVPLASIRSEYQVNPVNDLRPVCPNCHALIHRRTPPYTPEEVGVMLAKSGGKTKR